MSLLERTILATICYYDVLDYPLTSWEVWRFLINPHQLPRRYDAGPLQGASYNDVRRALRSADLEQYVTERRGMYMLRDRDHLSALRVQRQTNAIARWRRARWVAWILQGVPFVRLLAGSGSLALSNMNQESDLDFFIITAPRRIWTARLWVTVVTHLLGVRRHGAHVANRVCLNHFVTTDGVVIPHQTMYTAHLYAHLVPLINRGDAPTQLQQFWHANRWMEEFLAFPPLFSKDLYKGGATHSEHNHRRRVKVSGFLDAWARLWEWLLAGRVGDWIEYQARRLQLRWMNRGEGSQRTAHGAKSDSGRVVVSDTELAFHPGSPEGRILVEFHERLQEHHLSDAPER